MGQKIFFKNNIKTSDVISDCLQAERFGRIRVKPFFQIYMNLMKKKHLVVLLSIYLSKSLKVIQDFLFWPSGYSFPLTKNL